MRIGILKPIVIFWSKCSGMFRYPPPPLWTDRWMDGQTRVKTLPSRRTTYAGGEYGNLYWYVWKHT